MRARTANLPAFKMQKLVLKGKAVQRACLCRSTLLVQGCLPCLNDHGLNPTHDRGIGRR